MLVHPVLFTLHLPVGGEVVRVTTYAALLFVGAALAIGLTLRRGARMGLPLFDLFAAGVIGLGTGLMGAKIAYLLLNGPPPGATVLTTLVRGAGLVWYGGLIGGGAGAMAYLRAYRVPILPVLDAAAPGLALGQAFGRIGCLSAGCCYGRPAPGLPFAVRFPPGSLAPPFIPLHPVQLYESAALLGLTLVLILLARPLATRPAGTTGVIYLGGAALVRGAMETFRADDRGGTFLGLSPAQWIASGILLAIALLLATRGLKERQAKGRDAVKPGVDSLGTSLD